jgi:hypothetical protein
MNKPIISLLPDPGIQRDGTMLDSSAYTDGQWVRFQRRLPRKMGGYFRISDRLRGPITSSFVFSEDATHYTTVFGPNGIEAIAVDNNGLGGAISDRTPTDYVANSKFKWSVDSMYDAAAGSTQSVILAVAVDPDSSTEQEVYWAIANDLSAFSNISDVNAVAAGGVFCAPPYAVYYGRDGKVTWSNQNEPRNVTTGDAGTARVTGSKIVQGFSMNTGGGLGGLLWALDSVIRMDYVGGQSVFRFKKLSQSASILTQNTVVEYDGTYFWVGTDRFLMSDGSRVDELPNATNLNWFYDNLNQDYKHKVWGMKIPRFGEIWWFFPFGENTECSHAVIWNMREKCWYDVELSRGAGYHPQSLTFPIMSGADADSLDRILLYGVSGTFKENDLITGGTSEAVYQITRVVGSDTASLAYSITSGTVTVTETNSRAAGDIVMITSSGGTLVSGAYTIATRAAGNWTFAAAVADSTNNLVVNDRIFYTEPISGIMVAEDTLTNLTQTGAATVYSVDDTYSLYGHERGRDAVVGEQVSAIESYFTTLDFGSPTGGLDPNVRDGDNKWTRVTRVEPDFVQTGDMTLEILGQEFATSPEVIHGTFPFSTTTEKVDMRVQSRHVRLKFTSNTQDGHYEMGRVLIHTEPGDNRS